MTDHSKLQYIRTDIDPGTSSKASSSDESTTFLQYLSIDIAPRGPHLKIVKEYYVFDTVRYPDTSTAPELTRNVILFHLFTARYPGW